MYVISLTCLGCLYSDPGQTFQQMTEAAMHQNNKQWSKAQR